MSAGAVRWERLNDPRAMYVSERVPMGHRSRWSRLVATALVAALGLGLAPRPGAAVEPGCHVPASQNVVTTSHGGCGACAETTCVSMPRCAHVVVAVLVAPATGAMTLPVFDLPQPETLIACDLASRGPPTPPPNS